MLIEPEQEYPMEYITLFIVGNPNISNAERYTEVRRDICLIELEQEYLIVPMEYILRGK